MSEWTIDTLKEHLEERLGALQALEDERHRGTLDRLETMNGFRAALSDAQSHFITRDEYRVSHDGLGNRIDLVNGQLGANTAKLATQQTKIATIESVQTQYSSSRIQMILMIITAVGVVGTFVSYFFHAGVR